MSRARNSADYVTETGFTSGYVAYQEPKQLVMAAARAGQSTLDPTGAFRYCELGCATGTTLNMLAATHPEAAFIGYDFNQAHIDAARADARAAGLENVEFHCRDFESLAPDETPELDFLAIHGTYCWLSPLLAETVRRFAASALRPDGLFYIDTMMLPAKATVAPVWALMRACTDDDAPPGERVRDGLALLKQLDNAGSLYLSGNPPAARAVNNGVTRVLQQGNDQALRQIAHHALSRHWRPVYFAELAGEMSAAGFGFAGSVDHWLDLDACWDLPEWQALAQAVPAGTAREMLKDYWLNLHNRHSVFARQGAGSSAADGDRAQPPHRDTHVLGMVPPGSALREFALNGSQFRVPLDGAAWHWLVERLWSGSASLSGLLSESAGKLDPAQLERAFHLFYASGQGLILREPVIDASPPERFTTASVPDALNRLLLERCLRDGTVQVLGSATIGGGLVPVGQAEAWLLDWMQRQGDDSPGESEPLIPRLEKTLQGGGLVHPLNGQPVPAEALIQAWQRLKGLPLRNLVATGILRVA